MRVNTGVRFLLGVCLLGVLGGFTPGFAAKLRALEQEAFMNAPGGSSGAAPVVNSSPPAYWRLPGYGARVRDVTVAGGMAQDGAASGDMPGDTPDAEPQDGLRLFLPTLIKVDPFFETEAIWAQTNPLQDSQVVLFRRHFVLSAALQQVELFLLADTRYEVWVDGKWVGRGPARFTRTYQEYDSYALGELPAGEHVIAVLVQWAPNFRRSESGAPFLRGHVSARTLQGEPLVLLRTDDDWQALVSPAWSDTTEQVHSSYLVGPSEVLDLRLLPADWTALEFADSWPPARIQTSQPDGEPPAVQYALRSIPPLTNLPVDAAVIDAGKLSPAYTMIEVDGSAAEEAFLFETSAPATALLEFLAVSAAESPVIRVDGNKLDWRAAGAQRPNVYQAQVQVRKGKHTLALENIPPGGAWVNLARADIYGIKTQALLTGSPGKRLLLAEPVSDRSQAVVQVSAEGLQLEIPEPPAYVVLDLGRTVHGRLAALVEGPAGSLVDIGWDERLLPGTLRPLPYPGSLHPQWNQVDAWALDGAPRRIQTIDARAGRYVILAVWGAGPVRLRNVQISEERYPVVQRGSFESADQQLNQIWQIGVTTAQVNMLDAYADPWRERGQWWGDAYVVDQVNQVAFGDTALLRRGLLMMAENYRAQGGAPALAPNGQGVNFLDYFLLWIIKLGDYTNRTGDLAFARQNYPLVMAFLSGLERRADPATGLIAAAPGEGLYFYLDTLGFSSRTGFTAGPNAVYYGALRSAAELAHMLNDSAQAQAWEAAAARLGEQFNQQFYLPGEGRYLTGIRDGAPIPPNALAQAYALAFELVPAAEQPRVTEALVQLTGASPAAPGLEVYGFYWALDGLGRAGEIGPMLDLIHTYYGYKLAHGATTWWERFDADQFYWSALSHGWGSGPTYFLSAYLLGLQPAGVNTWQFTPALTGVAHVSGSLPLGDGSVSARWERLACESSSLVVQADENLPGEIVLDTQNDLAAVYAGERLLWQTGMMSAAFSDSSEDVSLVDGELHLTVGGGQVYALQLTHACAP